MSNAVCVWLGFRLQLQFSASLGAVSYPYTPAYIHVAQQHTQTFTDTIRSIIGDVYEDECAFIRETRLQEVKNRLSNISKKFKRLFSRDPLNWFKWRLRCLISAKHLYTVYLSSLKDNIMLKLEYNSAINIQVAVYADRCLITW